MSQKNKVYVSTQDELAEWLGVGPRQIRNLSYLPGKEGRKGYNVQECVITHIRHLQKNRQRGKSLPADGDFEPTNPEDTSIGVNLATEEARFSKLRNDKLELQIEELARKLAPVVMLREFAEKLTGAVCAVLDSIPGQVKRRNPKIRASDLAVITQEVTKAQNAARRTEIDLDQYQGLSEGD